MNRKHAAFALLLAGCAAQPDDHERGADRSLDAKVTVISVTSTPAGTDLLAPNSPASTGNSVLMKASASSYSLDLAGGYLPPPEWVDEFGAVFGPEFVSVEIGDFTGDGRNDIVAVLSAASRDALLALHLRAQNPDGSLASVVEVPINPYDMGAQFNGASNTATGDFNRDGVSDLLLTRRYGFSLFIADGRGRFVKRNFPSDLPVDVHPVVADIDRDGNLDVVMHHGPDASNPGIRSRVVVHYGDGMGAFPRSYTQYTWSTVGGGGEKAHSLASGDLNGDGFSDLAGVFQEWDYSLQATRHVVSLFYNDGQGKFLPAVKRDAIVPAPPGFPPSLFATLNLVGIGDMNGDGANDLIAVEQHAQEPYVRTYFQTPDGRLDTADTAIRTRIAASALNVGDLDADGFADLVLAHGGQNTMGYFMQRAKVLEPQVFRAAGTRAPAIGPTSLAIGDLDGDSCPDAVIAAQWEALYLYKGRGCAPRIRITGGKGQRL